MGITGRNLPISGFLRSNFKKVYSVDKWDGVSLSFGSFRLYGRKFRNTAHRGPQRRTVAHPKGFRVYMTDPLCDTHRFDLQRALLVGLWCPQGGDFGGGGW